MSRLFRLFGNLAAVNVLVLMSAISAAQEASQAELDRHVNLLRAQADDLASEITLLEQELLFPPLTRVQIYLSVSPDAAFRLRSLMVSVDGVEKSYHIYSDEDIAALRLGGIQRFWEGNVALGHHEVEAEFKGFDAKGNEYRQLVTFDFEKALKGHALELAVGQSADDGLVPSFTVKDWGESDQ